MKKAHANVYNPAALSVGPSGHQGKVIDPEMSPGRQLQKSGLQASV